MNQELQELNGTKQIDNEFRKLMNRLEEVFPGKPRYETCQKYLKGLLGQAERKNGW